MTALTYALALLLALLIDRMFGEPPVRLHPVVWMGNYLGWAGKRVQAGVTWVPQAAFSPQASTVGMTTPDYKSFWLAALYWCSGAAMFSVAFWWLESSLVQASLGCVSAGLSALASAVLLALLLKPMLAWDMLKSEVLAVEQALGQSLQAGRERLSWLVSRDTTTLSEAQVRESAIESLAENLNDSVVAPIFWFVLLGLPGAVAYRFANTADAMWGYKGVVKGQNWEWAGKWAARVDDVLNWLPARLTGCLLWLVSLAFAPSQAGGRLGWGQSFSLSQLHREAVKTPSPNSGWPMAAMALALDIRLGKPGVYVLNPAGGEPLAAQTPKAIVCASKVLLALVPLSLAALYFRAWIVA